MVNDTTKQMKFLSYARSPSHKKGNLFWSKCIIAYFCSNCSYHVTRIKVNYTEMFEFHLFILMKLDDEAAKEG